MSANTFPQVGLTNTFAAWVNSYSQIVTEVNTSVLRLGANTVGGVARANTGTVSTQGVSNVVVVGVGTKFLEQLQIGDTFVVGAESRTIVGIPNNIRLSVDTAFTAFSGNSFSAFLPANTVTLSNATFTVGNSSVNTVVSGGAITFSGLATFPGNATSAAQLAGKTEANLNVNSAATATSASQLGGKTEANLNVNSASTATLAASAALLGGKAEADLNVNSASVAALSASAALLNGKTEANLNVNNATTAYGKLESALNVNSAVNLSGSTVTSNSSQLAVGSNVAVNTTTVFVGNSTVNSVMTAGTLTLNGVAITSVSYPGTSANASLLNNKTEANLNVNNATTAYGKLESALNVNSAVSSSQLGGKAEGALNVNSAVNLSGSTVTTNSLQLTIGANAYVNTSAHFVGNSTANSILTGGVLTLNGVAITSVSYPGTAANASLLNNKTEANLNVNNSTTAYGKLESALNVNSAVSSTQLGGKTEANLNVNSAVNLTGSTVTTNSLQLTVGANAYVNTSAHFVGNSTSNSVLTGGVLTLNGVAITSVSYPGTAANASLLNNKTEANLNVNNATTAYGKLESALNVNNATTAYGKTEGALNVNSAVNLSGSTVTTNSLQLTVGANAYVNTSAHFVGNATVNSVMAAGVLTLNGVSITSVSYPGTAANSTLLNNKSEANLNVNNATTAYGKLESALNVNSAVSATQLGGKTEANLNVNSAVNLSGSTVTTNSLQLTIGANAYVNTSAHFVGNSTVNAVMTGGTLTLNGVAITSVSYPGTAANATLLNNKTEANLNVNNATTAYSKAEGALNANSAVNLNGSTVTTNSLNLAVGANVVVNTSAVFAGNSTVNTVITGSQVTANGFTGNGINITSLNATALLTGTVPLARLTSANTTANGVVDTTTQVFAGLKTFDANTTVNGVIVVVGSGLTANGSLGSAGHVLHSNGTSVYWGADATGGGGGGSTSNSSGGIGALQYDLDGVGGFGASANLVFTGTVLSLGNSSANIATNSSSVLILDGTNYSTIAAGGLGVGNSSANAIHTITSLTIANSTITSIFGTGTVNVGANVAISPSSVMVVNSTSNVVMTAGALTVGANVKSNTTTVRVDGASSFSTANSSISGVYLTADVARFSAMAYWGMWVGKNANSFVFTAASDFTNSRPVVNLAELSNNVGQIFVRPDSVIIHAGGTNGSPTSNSRLNISEVNFQNSTVNTTLSLAQLSVGANALVNTSAVFVGNSTVNTVIVGGAITFSGGATVNSTVYNGIANSSYYASDAAQINGRTEGELEVFSAYCVVTGVDVSTNATHVLVGNSTVNTVISGSQVTANGFTGNGINITSLNATALLTGTVPLGRLTSANTTANGVVDTTTQTLIGAKTFSNTTTLNGAVLSSGSLTLGETTSIALDPAGSADGKWSGFTTTAVAGYSQSFADLVYLSSVDTRWELADADAESTADRMLAMVVVPGASDGSACTLLLQGIIRADAKFPTFTIGSAVYVGETAGSVQVAIPTGADNIVRRVGFAMTADELYFCPSTDSQLTVA